MDVRFIIQEIVKNAKIVGILIDNLNKNSICYKLKVQGGQGLENSTNQVHLLATALAKS